MTQVRSGIADANGTGLYYEVRGDGPRSLICVPGAFGDGGGYEAMAERLADEYAVVVYDRRGNSRSPRPDGWTSTTVAEQADDLAALIEAIGLDRPIAFGSSGGGTIIVGLLERRPDVIRGAVVHEPGLGSVAPAAVGKFSEALGDTMQAVQNGDMDGVIESFARAIGGDAFEGMEALEGFEEMIERGKGNVDVLFGIEMPGMMSFAPDPGALAAATVPVHAAYGKDTALEFCVEAAKWVAEHSGGPLHIFPGGHMEMGLDPDGFVAALRPVLSSIA